MKSLALLSLLVISFPTLNAKSNPAETVNEIVSDYIGGKSIDPERVHNALRDFEIINLEFEGSLKELIREIDRRHPRVFWSFGATEALDEIQPQIRIKAERINLLDLLNETSHDGNFRWEYNIGKGLLIIFAKKDESDIRLVYGY